MEHFETLLRALELAVGRYVVCDLNTTKADVEAARKAVIDCFKQETKKE